MRKDQDNVAREIRSTLAFFLAYRHPKGSLENRTEIGMEFVKCI